jgi:glycosyltransferase involved in cell wall biosynthesis
VGASAVTSLIFVTQLFDESDSVLGFVPRWVEALASRSLEVAVIANEVRHPLPTLAANVRVASLGKEDGAGRLARTLRYERLLTRFIHELKADSLFAHMCPIYLNLAALVAAPMRLVTLLWFAHPARSPSLRLANALADGIVTSLPGPYPYPGPTVHVRGPATDAALLPFEPLDSVGPSPRLLALGRTSPSKGFDVVIRAVREARSHGCGAELDIVGPSTTPLEHKHRAELESLVARLGLEDFVRFSGGIPPAEVAARIHSAEILVNAMVSGSGDKVIFEAMSAGRPVLASNRAIGPLVSDLALDLTFRERDAADLARKIEELATAAPSDLALTLKVLRERVEAQHSLDHWADSVIALIRRLGERKRRREL